jgi:hypothetical protein
MINREAFKESFSDTILGTMVNFPLNYFMVVFCLWMEMGALLMTVCMTSVLFILAVARKYYVRIYFDRRNNA